MATKVDIWNLALSHLGIDRDVVSTTDSTKEAAALRLVYDVDLDEILRGFPWSFARKEAALVSVSASPAATDEWAYSYRVPSDSVIIRRIQSGNRQDNRTSRVPFVLSRDSTGLLVYTDEPAAKAVYTFRNVSTTDYPADFVKAFSYKLAAHIAPRLTAGDPFGLEPKMTRMFLISMSEAASSNAAEEQPDDQNPSEFERARG